VKMETLIFGILSVFFLLVTPIYWLLSHEIAGSVALGLTFFLSFIVTSYLFGTGRRMAPRPEDRLDGEISDSTGEVGFFSPHSAWPLWAGSSFGVCILGVAIGWWLFAIGVAFMLASIVGLCFEYYREDPSNRPGSQTVS